MLRVLTEAVRTVGRGLLRVMEVALRIRLRATVADIQHLAAIAAVAVPRTAEVLRTVGDPRTAAAGALLTADMGGKASPDSWPA